MHDWHPYLGVGLAHLALFNITANLEMVMDSDCAQAYSVKKQRQ